MTPTRLAPLLGGLSLATDVANGMPPEKALRTTWLATRIGQLFGLTGDALRDVYYVNLLRFLGCTAFAHEEANLYGAGDDIATRSVMAIADIAQPAALLKALAKDLAPSAPVGARLAAGARLLGDGRSMNMHARSQCETSIRLARLIGFSAPVQTALGQICERFDGKGTLLKIAGGAIDVAIRLHHIADVVEIVHHRHGRDEALAELRRRDGKHFDPELVRIFVEHAPELFTAIERTSFWDTFLEIEPAPHATADETRLDDVALAYAHFADLKSTYMLGHSTGVAELCTTAAKVAGLDEKDTRDLRRAALLHDIGRVSVATGVWDKPAPLSPSEWERVRLHAYYTERVVWQTPPLRALAPIAAGAHERLDGAGYHRAIPRNMLARSARILEVADAYHAMREHRPHRPALDANAARKLIQSELSSGRFDEESVHAVLEAAGEPRSRLRGERPCGLSEREVEVLCRLARGRSNKEIAQELGISPRTVQHHVEHVYSKIDVSCRAAAALFATQHGLIDH